MDLMLGSEPSLNCSVSQLVSGSQIFEKRLIKVKSSELRLLSQSRILHKLADVLFN